MSDELSAVRQKVIDGEVEESVLLETTKKMADHAQALLEAVNGAQWKTAYYNDHVGLLKACVGALAEYDKKLGELLTLMGA